MAGRERYLLKQGDAIHFEADVPHAYRNVGDSEALLYLVMQYVEAIGRPQTRLVVGSGRHLGHAAHHRHHALAGLGIALAPAILIEADLAAARLVRLASDELLGDFAYYIVHPKEKDQSPGLRAFKSWLKQAIPAVRVWRRSFAQVLLGAGRRSTR